MSMQGESFDTLKVDTLFSCNRSKSMLGINMDDLDHSMRIADNDWTSFCEDSEECSLLKPSIACPDSSGISDSEESENPSPAFNTDQRETQRGPDVTGDGAKNIAIRSSKERESCKKLLVQLNKNGAGGKQDDVSAKPKEKSLEFAEEDSELCLVWPARNSLNTKEVCIETAEETETVTISNKLKKVGGDLQTEIENSTNEPDPRATEGAQRKDVSSVSSRAEKERWFVTVNDSPPRQQAAASSVKKKRRQKKPCKNTWSSKQEKSVENCSEVKGKDKRGFTELKQNSEGAPSAKMNDHSSQMCCKDKKLSQILLISNELDSSFCTSCDILTRKDPSQVDSAESDALEEFVSVHSCDSESYLSAAESAEDTLYHLKDRVIENQLLFPTTSHLKNTEHTPDRELHQGDSTLSSNASATNCNGCEGTGVEPTLAFPSAGRRAKEMPDDNSTCDNHTHSTELCMPPDTPRLQKQETNLSASGSSSGHQLSPLPVPDFTVTPCSVTSSSEAHAEAAGPTRPVYAISAFWDEMEKLTINDILQLRMGRSTPPGDTQESRETAARNAHGFPTNHTVFVENGEHHLSDGGPVDKSDVADSDYFTQPDESKPDCSSCEFSTSDFEEECWHFIGASRDSSPDPQHKRQPTISDSYFLSHEESLFTCTEGKDAPIPSQACAGQHFADQGSDTSMKPSWSRQITKSKTEHNVQALNTENFTLKSLFCNDDSGLFLSHSQSLEANLALYENDSIETLVPAPVLSSTDTLDKHYQISLPEVFEYFFTQDKTESDSTCAAVYNPDDISVASVFDCTVCTFRNKMSYSSLHDSQCSKEKPIPIFSCSHPTVRELAFPKPDYVFLNADQEEEDSSPIRVVCHSFTQAGDCGAGASRSWKNLLSIRKICFHDKRSMWCRRSGAWVSPAEADETPRKRTDPPVSAVTEGRLSLSPAQLVKELAVYQRIWETIHATNREGIFSTLKQSDMCLVCIAFASWVLSSSDPKAADAWKAALLANVSALSAIQFLRKYVKKTPLQDDT